jgi:hypothetical protein
MHDDFALMRLFGGRRGFSLRDNRYMRWFPRGFFEVGPRAGSQLLRTREIALPRAARLELTRSLESSLLAYGPAVLYAPGSLQALFCEQALGGSTALLRFESRVELRGTAGDETREIVDLRNELEPLIMTVIRRPKPPLPPASPIPAISTSAPMDVAANLFFPWIIAITNVHPSNILVLLDAMNGAFENPPPEFRGAELLLRLLRKFYKSTTTPPEAYFPIIQFYIKLIRGCHKATELLRLASTLSIRTVQPDIASILSDFTSSNSIPITFDDFLEPPVRLCVCHVMNPMRWPSCPQRLAANDGYVYIFEKSKGLYKFGTGRFGTVLGSSVGYSAFTFPVDSLAISGDQLLVGSSRCIKILSSSDFVSLGDISDPPPGYFTCCGDIFYFLHGDELNIYRFSFPTFTSLRSVVLDPPPRYVLCQIAVLDGQICTIPESDDFKCGIYCIETGKLLKALDLSPTPLAAAFDSVTRVFVLTSQLHSDIEVRPLHRVWRSSLEFRAEGIIRAAVLGPLKQTVSPEFSSAFSIDSSSPSEILSFLCRRARTPPMVEAAVKLLTVVYRSHQSSVYPSADELVKILDLPGLSSFAKTDFLQSLIAQRPPNLLGSIDFKLHLSLSEIAEAFSDGVGRLPDLMNAILHSNLLSEAALDICRFAGFFGNFVSDLVAEIMNDTFPNESILPVLDALSNLKTLEFFPSLLTPLFPFIRRLDSPPDSLFRLFSLVLSQYDSQSLTEFASRHREIRSHIGPILREFLHETQHPCESGKAVETLDIEGSISADIEFFPRCEMGGGFRLIIVARRRRLIAQYEAFDPEHEDEWRLLTGIRTDQLNFGLECDPYRPCFGYAAKIRVSYPVPNIFESPPLAYDLDLVLWDMIKDSPNQAKVAEIALLRQNLQGNSFLDLIKRTFPAKVFKT